MPIYLVSAEMPPESVGKTQFFSAWSGSNRLSGRQSPHYSTVRLHARNSPHNRPGFDLGPRTSATHGRIANITSGQLPGTNEDWHNLDAAMRRGCRGLPKTSLSRLLAARRGYPLHSQSTHILMSARDVAQPWRSPDGAGRGGAVRVEKSSERGEITPRC
jgi:hypothetical protein